MSAIGMMWFTDPNGIDGEVKPAGSQQKLDDFKTMYLSVGHSVHFLQFDANVQVQTFNSVAPPAIGGGNGGV